MKRKWPYYLATLCFALLLAFAFRYWGRIFPSGYVSEVYSRYCEREDIRVEFFKDFRVDDSTVVDVTTLTARDSASWENLLREMNQSESMILRKRELVNEGYYTLSEYYCELGHPEHRIPYDENGCWLVFMNHAEKNIFIFHIINHKQAHIISSNKMKESFKNAKTYKNEEKN